MALPFGAAFVARHGDQRRRGCTSLGRHQLGMAAASASSATACSGLTAAALPETSVPSFQKLCRAVGSNWGVVSADTLFRLRRGMPDKDDLAALAFHQLFAAADVSEAAELITAAAGEHKTFGSLAAADKAAADVVLRAAEAINAQRGGLYAGGMECLRATICVVLYKQLYRKRAVYAV